MKFNIKFNFFVLTILFFILTIILITSTFARYLTALTATSTVEMGSWSILVNNQNIMENANLSEYIIPVFNGNPTYIAEDKIVPSSSGYVEINFNYEEVSVPFEYKISFAQGNSTPLDDFKLINYSIDGGSQIAVDDSFSSIVGTINPDGITTEHDFLLNFTWIDDNSNSLDDFEDTAYSRNFDELNFLFNIEFTQLESLT